jgi:4-amino-4-deoxy-L-arabinose transferase-like glycosyltransferase
LICWITWWREQRSKWLTWTVPWFVLGLGILAKGPVHLVFFYAVAVALLYREGQLRRLLHLPHLVGLLAMTAVFAAWAFPYWREMAATNVGQTWSAQLTGRFTGDDFKLGSWLLNIPRGLAYFLPWALLLPAVAKAKWPSPGERNLAWALAWGAAIPFLAVNLLPGGLPRYSMPALVPACWLMAMTLANTEFPWRGKIFTPAGRFRLVIGVIITASVVVWVYSAAIVPALQRRTKVKPIAAEIDRLVPDTEPLYALDPDYQPFLFYVRSRLVYVSRLEEVPATARYLLIQPEMEEAVRESQQWSPLHAQTIERFTDYRRHTSILAKVGE